MTGIGIDERSGFDIENGIKEGDKTASPGIGRQELIKIEYRISNKEPQNFEGDPSTFDILDSIFCGLKKMFIYLNPP